MGTTVLRLIAALLCMLTANRSSAVNLDFNMDWIAPMKDFNIDKVRERFKMIYWHLIKFKNERL